MTEFGHIIGLNVGTISGIVTGNRSLSINQLDRITIGMNLPADYFYERFVEECIIEVPLNWRRVKPFLHRCIELGRLDCLQHAVSMFLDDPIYSPSLFKLAEDLFHKGYRDTAAYLYENVAESERKQHSERLAICQYRLFTIRVGDDQEKNYNAAVQFEPYIERLDEIDQLDALKDLANVYRSLRKWDKVEEMARKMKEKAKVQYLMKHQQKKRECGESKKKLSRSLFVYITYADLLCASVCEAQGDYQQALQFTYAYSNLDWVRETDEDTKHWIGLFKHWSQANILACRLLSGDVSVIHDYFEYISTSSDTTEEDRVVQLLNVLIAANQHQVNVDYILQRFETEIDSITRQQASADMYTYQVVPGQTTLFEYEVAKYYLNRGRYSYGFKYLLDVLAKSLAINKEDFFIRCIKLFEQFKEFADIQAHAKYEILVTKGKKYNFFYY